MVLRQPAALDAAVDEVFAWVVFLPGADRALFVDELVRTLVAAAEVENLAPVAQLLREWRATAEIHADPALARRLSGPITTSGGSITVPAG